MVNLWGPGAFGAARPAAVRPSFTPGNGPGDPDDWFQDCSSPTARDGTEWRSAGLNKILAVMRQVVRKSSVTADNTDDDLLAKAIASGSLIYVVATGTANAWVVAPNLAVPAYAAGRVLNIVAPATNSSTTVNMNVSGLGNRRIKKSDGSDPAIGDLVSGQVYATIDDGTNIRILSMLPSDVVSSASIVGRTQIFTASGTFTVPASVNSVEVQVIGGGGAGGASGNGSAGGVAGNIGAGGGAGGYGYKRVFGLTPGGTVAVTVGAGGTPSTSATSGAGGSSSFGSHVTCNGGAGGAYGISTTGSGGSGGTVTGADLPVDGGSGGFSGPNSGTVSTSDIFRIYGRGGPAAGGLGVVPTGGTGNAGQGYGAGGTGASGGSLVLGGAGAPGIVIVRW